MSDKNLKLGWTVSETIGIAVVNPRGVSSMKAIPKFYFHNEGGGIDIRRYSIEIIGNPESAAKAFAEGILSKKDLKPGYDTWQYCDVIDIVYTDNKYYVSLTGNGLGLIDQDVWMSFKKNVQTICNDLKAFL